MKIMKSSGVVLVVLLTCGCAVGPDYKAPVVALEESFSSAPSGASTEVPAAWWSAFSDATLDSLVREAVAGSQTIHLAHNRVREARALLGLNTAEYYPSVDLTLGYEKGRESSATTGTGQTRSYELYSAGMVASWEIDIFGRTRRAVEAADAELEAADASLRDAKVLVVAEVARTYLVLRGTQTRLHIAEQSARAQRETLQLVQARLEVGRGNALDVARSQSQVDSTSAMVPVLRGQISAAIHRLSVLTGLAPSALRERLGNRQPAPQTPVLAGVSQPKDLLRARPDLRIAERRIAAANAGIGIATADLYPTLSIVGSVGWLAPKAGGLGEREYETYSILPGIRWGILDLQRVRSRIAVANVRADGALLAFELKLLQALEETENALVMYGVQIQRRGYLRSNADASRLAADLAMQRYRDGAASFLDVLDSERSLLTAQDQLAQTEQDASVALVLVYAALGGGPGL